MQKTYSMIFKIISGDLTVFNKTLISTKNHLNVLEKAFETVNVRAYNKNGSFYLQGLLVNSSQSVSTFTKLNNAFQAYNGNLSKSTQLQNAYILAVGKQNSSLGNYLAGLNGAKASMGGYIKSLISAKAATIGLQVASFALNAAISMGITLAISALVSAITKLVNKEKEFREEAIENAKTAKEETNNLSELLNKYNQLSEAVKTDESAKEDLMSTQTELLKKLELEGKTIDDLIAKYGSLSEAINQVSIDTLKDAQIDLIAGVGAAKKELLDVAKNNFWGTKNTINATGKDAVKAFKELEKAGIVSSGSYGSAGGSFSLIGDEKTVEGALENFKKLEEAINALRDSEAFTGEELSENSLFKAIYKRYSEMKVGVDSYMSAIGNLNENLSQQAMLTALQGSEIPKTEEAFETFKQELIDTAIASKEFIGNEEQITDAINAYLASVPEFAGYYSIPLENEFDKVDELLNQEDFPKTFASKLTNSEESLDKFQSSVKSAADAYATLLSGNYSSTELLDSIQAINQAVTDMGESIDWEDVDWKDLDSLDLFGNKLEEVSQKYAESILSGAGIDDSEFSQILTDIVSQMYKVEAEFTGMNAQFDRLQSSYQTLTGILESYNETGYVSLDNLQSLLTADENLIAMLEVENGQLVINQAAYENLVATQLLEFKAKLNDAAAAEIEALAKNKSEEATNNNAQASEDAVAKLDAETEAFNRNTSAAIANAMQKAEEAGVSEEEIQGVLNKYTEIWNAAMNNYSTDFPTFMNGAKSSASSAGEAAGKSAGEAFTDSLDKELTALDKKLEAGYIDFNDYIQARLNLIEDYYNQGKLSADEYYSYLEKHYDTRLSYMDKAVNAVTRRIDKEIDALKQQKENVEDIYKVQIESLEEEKNLLEEANKERQRQKDLQKSLYDLERARNQRTRLVYSEDKGMHYAADDQSIRDAQENVDNARYDIRIAEIDKSISKLEEARDKETNAIDEMISNLESYKDAWNDITSAYEEEQENLIAAQILGADWETDILNGRLDVLDAFKNQYIGIQQAMAAAAWESANEQIKAAKEAEKGSSGSTSNAPKSDSKKDKQKKDLPQLPTTSSGGGGGGGGSHSLGLSDHKLVYASLKAYSSGTNNAKKGLNLVGEGGTEAYFDNHGHVAIVTKPTLIPMEGGEVVKNERDTEKLLDPDNLAPVDTISVLTPIQSGSLMWDLQEKFNAYISKMGEDISSVMAPVDFIQKDMARTVNGISTTNNITNTGMQQVTIGDIHVTRPGVTSQEVARQVGVELNRQFSGFSLVALQESKK